MSLSKLLGKLDIPTPKKKSEVVIPLIRASEPEIEKSKRITKEEIEHCLPVMEMLGFKLKPINNNNQTK